MQRIRNIINLLKNFFFFLENFNIHKYYCILDYPGMENLYDVRGIL